MVQVKRIQKIVRNKYVLGLCMIKISMYVLYCIVTTTILGDRQVHNQAGHASARVCTPSVPYTLFFHKLGDRKS